MRDNRYLKQRDMAMSRGGRGDRYPRMRAKMERDEMDRRGGHSDYKGGSGYQDYNRGNNDYRRDYGYNNDYNDYNNYNDYNDYTYDGHGDSEKKYHEDLERWIEKLKRKDRFKIKKEEIIANAKNMGVRFDDFSEDEFYAVYLMELSDHPQAYNEYRSYLVRAKEWLEDDDIEVSPSEKLCIYFYKIVKGEEFR